jgi:hypothetical protein
MGDSYAGCAEARCVDWSEMSVTRSDMRVTLYSLWYNHLHKVISRRHKNANRLNPPHYPEGIHLGQFCTNRAQI